MKLAIGFAALLVLACAWPALAKRGSCGRAPLGMIMTRIINGVDARPGEFPWLARLITTKGADPANPGLTKASFCGGSLIDDNIVLTAAHCEFDFASASPLVHVSR